MEGEGCSGYFGIEKSGMMLATFMVAGPVTEVMT